MKWSKKSKQKIEQITGTTFNGESVLRCAFTHRSYLNEHKSARLQSNERLEFLGDSVLSLITSVALYQRFPKLHEGEYTSIKSALVRTESLAETAKRLGLNTYLLLSKGEEKQKGRENPSILADCYEALIAAIFLDRGIDQATEFVTKTLFDQMLDDIVKERSYTSSKNELQEYLQESYKMLPEYRVVNESGPEHDKKYVIGVYFEGKLLARAQGSSKKHAQEQAAELAMRKIKSGLL